jgi:hypothetical protein
MTRHDAPEVTPVDDAALDAALPALRTSPDAATLAPARAAFLKAADLERRPAARAFDRLWTRGLEPALFGISSLAYLIWLGVALSPK